METERYLTAPEVEKFSGRKLQTLANERHQGRGIPYYKVGSSIRYKLSDVISFMERHRIDPEARREIQQG
ncbi:MAG: helix-turn-helix domain-containing protein [Deltaproteobacteria bacterium]|nr:helix-turn-helix domain-containing protein [Deltaproteobacteria bacterium]